MQLQKACYAAMDGFMNMPSSEYEQKSRNSLLEILASLISYIVVITLIALIGKWLWNDYVVELISFAKPAKNVYQILGLFIFWSLLR